MELSYLFYAKHKEKQKKPALANKTNYALVGYAFYGPRAENKVR